MKFIEFTEFMKFIEYELHELCLLYEHYKLCKLLTFLSSQKCYVAVEDSIDFVYLFFVISKFFFFNKTTIERTHKVV